MISSLISKIGLPLFIEAAKQGLEHVDNPVAQKASKALQQVESAVEQGKISEEELQKATEYAQKIREIERLEYEAVITQINESLRMESTSSDSFVRRMRPTFGYVMALTWAAQMFSVAYIIVRNPEKALDIIMAMESLSTIWTVGLSVLGIYVYKRSQEKGAGGQNVLVSKLFSLFKKQKN